MVPLWEGASGTSPGTTKTENQGDIDNYPGRWVKLLHETEISQKDFYLCEHRNEIHGW